jgi:tetratricopeptide (TPR) repeat protein
MITRRDGLTHYRNALTRLTVKGKVVRRTLNTIVFSFAAMLISGATPSSAHAQTAFVLGGGLAADCFQAVKRNAPNRSTRALCDRALQDEALSQHDLTATLVNRGITALRNQDGAAALADFNAALRQDPAFAPAFLNRAGAYLQLGRFLDAKVDADTALVIGLKEDEWAAHFNKGVALENMGQIADAFAAFQRAAALAPTQQVVVTELARFQRVAPSS